MTNDDTTTHRTLETVARACDVIQVLASLDGGGVTEVATEIGVSKSSAHSYLRTLEEKRMVVQTGNEYRLSLEFLYLGNTIRDQHCLYQYGREQIDQLAAESGEYAHLMCEQHGLERNIYKATGEKAVGTAYHSTKEQQADYLHFTATGKAVLAHLPRSRVDEIINEHGLESRTPKTIVEREALLEELNATRERGYAYNNEEEIKGIRAVGAPIESADGRVLGALSISGPSSRLSGSFYRDTLPELVTEGANVIEARINMSEEK
ncbi:IclR family transcriptional regulator [Natronolimnobius sp. AArcel1]|uniref:IclR family transcriptional regulator n=1 Tax=Natronolimnobius sp. AArcel1 TaxID=1679093 RepID=UPI0013EAD5C4|nr:IclR family transcriptional regulator [Natronolimnobius sp. AArcel1]NGM70529.1 IclR family transcriptional regulator [Natronolimnobius sp. AArcel1]